VALCFINFSQFDDSTHLCYTFLVLDSDVLFILTDSGLEDQ